MKPGRFNSLAPLVALFHRSYAVPLLACLYAERGAKFVTLVNRLGASRDAVSMTLKYLVEMGAVVRNPGHGHPLRPEYVLTRAGEQLGARCAAFIDAVDRLEVRDVAFRKWPMPVVVAIGHGANRFSGLIERLEGMTPRALTGALRELDGRHIVTRQVAESWPPRPYYELARVGELLLPSLDRLWTMAVRVA